MIKFTKQQIKTPLLLLYYNTILVSVNEKKWTFNSKTIFQLEKQKQEKIFIQVCVN